MSTIRIYRSVLQRDDSKANRDRDDACRRCDPPCDQRIESEHSLPAYEVLRQDARGHHRQRHDEKGYRGDEESSGHGCVVIGVQLFGKLRKLIHFFARVHRQSLSKRIVAGGELGV